MRRRRSQARVRYETFNHIKSTTMKQKIVAVIDGSVKVKKVFLSKDMDDMEGARSGSVTQSFDSEVCEGVEAYGDCHIEFDAYGKTIAATRELPGEGPSYNVKVKVTELTVYDAESGSHLEHEDLLIRGVSEVQIAEFKNRMSSAIAATFLGDE